MLQPLAFIQKFRPKSFVSENVSALVIQKKNQHFVKFFIKELEEADYLVQWRHIDSGSYGPQRRLRWYLVGLRRDVMRKRGSHPIWPLTAMDSCDLHNSRSGGLKLVMPMNKAADLKTMIKPLPRAEFKLTPENGMTKKKNVEKALSDVVAAGVNPFQHTVIVDAMVMR